MTVGAHRGAGVLAIFGEVAFLPITFIMVAGGVLVEGREIHLGALTFIADDSAWLQEAPLDVDALPVRGATHFRACVRGVLLRQPSTLYWSTPLLATLLVSHQRKRSGQSRLQQWVKHAVARQMATAQVAAIEPDESLYGPFDLFRGDSFRVCKQRPCGGSPHGRHAAQASWVPSRRQR